MSFIYLNAPIIADRMVIQITYAPLLFLGVDVGSGVITTCPSFAVPVSLDAVALSKFNPPSFSSIDSAVDSSVFPLSAITGSIFLVFGALDA